MPVHAVRNVATQASRAICSAKACYWPHILLSYSCRKRRARVLRAATVMLALQSCERELDTAR
eukprot:1161979-Pelagomonas_calceolata.AAC.16